MNNIYTVRQFVSLLLLFCLPLVAQTQIIYVAPTGTGTGSSWADATSDLVEVLATATVGTQIHLLAGTYYPTQCSNCTIADRLATFEIPNGVTLMGGFVRQPDGSVVRDWQQQPTILSGNIDRDATPDFNSFNVILTRNVSNSTLVDGITIADGNANSLTLGNVRATSGGGWYNEGTSDGMGSAPFVINCSFVNNYAIKQGGAMHNESGFGGITNVLYDNCRFVGNRAGEAGGAIYNQASFSGQSNSRFSNCLFENNRSEGAGGAIYSNGSEAGSADVRIISCNFKQNTASGQAGAIYNRGSNNGHCNARLIGCNFTNNTARDAGAIMNDGGFGGESSPIITACYFRDNQAQSNGGAVSNNGNFNGQSHPVFTNCTFDKNVANNGGGVYSDGAQAGDSHPTFESCQFFNNTAYLGGAAYQFGKGGSCEPIFRQSIFVGNQAEEGAGLYNDASFAGRGNFVLENCRFSNNRSTSNGGAMYNLATSGGEIVAKLTNCTFNNNFSGFAGAGMFNNGISGNCSPTLTNCQFIANATDTYGAAMYNQGKSGNASPTIINCLFSKNTAFSAGGIYNLGAEFGNSSPTITNCTFYANRAHVGGAVYSNAAEENIGTAAPQITNCIFYKNFANFGDIFRVINGNPIVNHCQFDQPDCAALYSGIDGQITCGDGLIFMEEPLFVDTAAGNFHLRAAAPGIDRGDNSVIARLNIATDLDNHPRIQNGQVDLGVYEVEVTDTQHPFTVITNTSNQDLCAGATTELRISVTGVAPFFYQWFHNQNAVPAAVAPTLPLENISLDASGSYYCRVINAAGDTLQSDLIQINVQSETTVQARIFAEHTQLCTGTAAYFWAETAGGGTAPIYDWRINNVSQGINNNTFNQPLNDGDAVTLHFRSSETCPSTAEVVSDAITVRVTPSAVVSVAVATEATTVCAAETVKFTAVAENGGDAPSYQWFLDETPIGANAATIYLQLINPNNRVRCQLTSSLTCANNNTVSSPIVTVAVEDAVQPSIAINTDSLQFCAGNAVTFEANIAHGGDTPFYQWSVNNVIVSEGAPTFTTDNLADGDVISCLLISTAACVTTNEVFSNILTINATNCTTPVDEYNFGTDVLLFPNPAREIVHIDLAERSAAVEWQLYNWTGQTIRSERLEQINQFSIATDGLPRGTYLLQLNINEKVVVKPLVVW